MNEASCDADDGDDDDDEDDDDEDISKSFREQLHLFLRESGTIRGQRIAIPENGLAFVDQNNGLLQPADVFQDPHEEFLGFPGHLLQAYSVEHVSLQIRASGQDAHRVRLAGSRGTRTQSHRNALRFADRVLRSSALAFLTRPVQRFAEGCIEAARKRFELCFQLGGSDVVGPCQLTFNGQRLEKCFGRWFISSRRHGGGQMSSGQRDRDRLMKAR